MKTWKTTILAAAFAAITVSGLAAAEPRASLFQRLGGMPVIRAVVDDFVSRILADERVNKWFAHAASDPVKAAAYKRSLADFPCQGAGGPCRSAITPAGQSFSAARPAGRPGVVA